MQGNVWPVSTSLWLCELERPVRAAVQAWEMLAPCSDEHKAHNARRKSTADTARNAAPHGPVACRMRALAEKGAGSLLCCTAIDWEL